jgi:hypothetical protein
VEPGSKAERVAAQQGAERKLSTAPLSAAQAAPDAEGAPNPRRTARARWWLWLAKGRRSAVTMLRVLAPVVLVLLLLHTFKLLHRLDEVPQLSPPQMQAALLVARATAEAAAAGRSPRPPDQAALDEIVATQPVFVTIYGPDRAGRTEPAVGRWEPTADEPDLPLPQAIAHAAQVAGDKLNRSGRRSLRSTVVKIDLAGPPRNLWLCEPCYLGLVMDPGRDGLRATRGQWRAWSLPSRLVERGLDPASAVRKLVAELDEAEGSLAVARFRTTSFVEDPLRNGTVHPLLRGNVLAPEPSVRSVRRALARAGDFLARSVRQDGTYCYQYDPLQDRCLHAYNLLRHAGTTYSLYQVYRQLLDPTLLTAAERATEWLRRQVRVVDGDPSRAFLLEGDKAKLGAVGLSIIALVEREQAVGDGRDADLLAKLATFAISQQREDGYFYSYFAYAPGVRVPRQNSIYYPGEALLGLVRLYGIDSQPRYLEAARRSAEFLVKRRWRWATIELYVPPDAWLTQALAELDAITPEDWLRDYAYRIVRVTEMTMLRAEDGAPPDLVGGPASGFAFPGVTPAGSRIEGATAAWRMALGRAEADVAARLRALSLLSARFQLNQQYRPENSYFLPRPARASGGFRGSPVHSHVRIDYVQHNATALLGVLELLQEEAQP